MGSPKGLHPNPLLGKNQRPRFLPHQSARTSFGHCLVKETFALRLMCFIIMDKEKEYNWSEYDKKYKRITIKYKPNEYAEVVKQAKKSGQAVAAYIRECSMSTNVLQKSELKDTPLIDQEMLDLLRKVGNNHNQLLKKINIYGQEFILGNMKLIDQCEEIAIELSKLNKIFERD